jgi:enoyl-CoA hydratase/carnithine racemase
MSIVSSQPILFEIRDSAAWLTINRPGAGNAMTWAMYDALADACEEIDRSPHVRVFVIRANGGVFCTGTDISQFTEVFTREAGAEYERRLEACVSRLEDVGVPTIAQVEGIAAGAGCVLALACDFRVCTPAARFGVPIARTLGNGLSLENCARLVQHFGMARTRIMLIAGDFVDAADAAACGAVSRMADPGSIAAAVADLAAAVSRNAPLTIRAARAALRRLSGRMKPDASEIADLVADCYASADFREGVASFLAKRKPTFKGL